MYQQLTGFSIEVRNKGERNGPVGTDCNNDKGIFGRKRKRKEACRSYEKSLDKTTSTQEYFTERTSHYRPQTRMRLEKR